MTKRETFINGPTDQRLTMADGHVAIGDDKQGKRVYHFLDSSLDRVCSSLARKAGASDQAQLGAEYAALTRFQRYYCDAGLMGESTYLTAPKSDSALPPKTDSIGHRTMSGSPIPDVVVSRTKIGPLI